LNRKDHRIFSICVNVKDSAMVTHSQKSTFTLRQQKL
jgi:hypothetical protein